jgi:ribonucleotide monophosphatase NagD (HAD superfamily)
MTQMTVAAGQKLTKGRILAVGDGLLTDIKGAAQNQFDAYFIAGGIHSEEIGDVRNPDHVARACGLIRHWFAGFKIARICDQLRWT